LDGRRGKHRKTVLRAIPADSLKKVVNDRILLLNDNLDSPRTVETEHGTVVVFSQRAPGSTDLNEDSALVVPTDHGVVLAVADGAGGCAEGEVASRLAIETLGGQLEHPSDDVRFGVLDAFDEANKRVLSLGSGAATTLSVVHLAHGVHGPQLRSFHAGDSSVLVTGGRGRVKLNTIPHSPVGYAVEAGLLDPEEALHHRDLNLVSNMVGQADMRIEMGSALALATRDTVVIGTDGLFDNVHLWEIIQLARRGPLPDAAARLIELAHARMNSPDGPMPSKPDDLTFALFRPRKALTKAAGRSGVRRAHARVSEVLPARLSA